MRLSAGMQEGGEHPLSHSLPSPTPDGQVHLSPESLLRWSFFSNNDGLTEYCFGRDILIFTDNNKAQLQWQLKHK